jgi:hypothetical protein
LAPSAPTSVKCDVARLGFVGADGIIGSPLTRSVRHCGDPLRPFLELYQ